MLVNNIYTKQLEKLYGGTYIHDGQVQHGQVYNSKDDAVVIPILTKSTTSVMYTSLDAAKECKVVISLSASSIHGRGQGTKIKLIVIQIKKGYNLLTVDSMYGGCITLSNIKGRCVSASYVNLDMYHQEGSMQMEIAKIGKEFVENGNRYRYEPSYADIGEETVSDSDAF